MIQTLAWVFYLGGVLSLILTLWFVETL